MKSKKASNIMIPDGNLQLKKVLLSSLSKLSSSATIKTAHTELRSLINQLSPQQLPTLIHLISDPQDLQDQTKKEYIKVFASVSEAKGSDLIDCVKKIVQVINKRIHEGSNTMHQVIADTLGVLNECTIQRSDQGTEVLFQTIQVLQSNFQHNNKSSQQASAMALTKLIQTTQIGVLLDIMIPYVQKTIDILISPSCQTKCGLLESLLSLLLTVETHFLPLFTQTCEVLILCLDAEEWSARKVAIDLIYTLSVILPDEIIPFTEQLVHKLSDLRKDKIKYVREAAQVAILNLKDLNPALSQPVQSNLQRQTRTNKSSKYLDKKSLFQQAMNEDFFKQAKSDIQIKENNPKNIKSVLLDSRIDQETYYDNYTYISDMKYVQPQSPKDDQYVVQVQTTPKKEYYTLSKDHQSPSNISTYKPQQLSTSPLANQYFGVRSSAQKQYNPFQDQDQTQPSFYDSLGQVQSNLAKDSRLSQKQDPQLEQYVDQRIKMLEVKFAEQLSQMNVRMNYFEQLLEHIYDGLMNNNLIQRAPLSKDYKQQIPTSQTAKFNFLVNEQTFQAVNQVKDPIIQQQQNYIVKQQQPQNSINNTFNDRVIREQNKRYPIIDEYAAIVNSSDQKIRSTLTKSSRNVSKQDLMVEQDVNKKINDSLFVSFGDQTQDQNIQETYSLLLTQPDEGLLVSTMKQTGPCCQKLDITQVEFLINKLRIMIVNHQNVNLAIEWIYDALVHHKPSLSPLQLKKLLEQFRGLENYECQKVVKLLMN